MKLFYMPGACSLSPHIVALEAGLPIELARVADGKTPDGRAFNQVNPKGYVPTIELDNGEVLTEGAVIVQYLADLKPESGLMPASGMERYRMQEWLVYIGTELHKGFGPVFSALFRGGPVEAKDLAITALKKKFDWLQEQLQGKQYLTGDRFTVADAYLFTVLNWTKHASIDLSPWANLAAFQARVAARPHVQEALQAEGLLTTA